MADGKVIIEILGDSAKFESEVSKLADKASKSVSSVGSSLSRVGTGLTAAITAPLAAATVAGVKWAASTASNAEQVNLAFTTMLKSPERAQEMIQKLVKFARETPFDMPGLQTATQHLLAYGFAADDVIPMLTDIGNAAAGLGIGQQGIDSITRALGQMHGKTVAASQEMMQLTEAGIPAWEYLAKALNTDVAGAMKAVEKRTVSADTAIKAIREGMQGDFGGLMAEQAKTLSGALSNLGDAAKATVMEIYKTDGYKTLTKAIQNLSDPMQHLFEAIMPLAEKALEKAGKTIENLAGAISKMSPEQIQQIAKSIGMLAGVGPTLLVTGKALEGAGSGLSIFSKVAGVASKATKTISGELPKIAKSAADFGGKFKAGFQTIGSSVQKALSNIVFSASGFASKFAQSFDGLLSPIKEKFSSMGKNAAEFFATGFEMAGNTVKAAAEGIANVAKTAFDTIAPHIASVAQAISSKLSPITSAAGNIFKTVADKVKSSFEGIAGHIQGAFSGVAGSLSKFFEPLTTALSGAKTAVVTFAKDIATNLGNVGKTIGDVLGPAFSNIGSTITGSIGPALSFGGKLVSAFGSATVILGALSLAAVGAAVAFTAMGGDVGQAVANIGSSIVGLANEIPAMSQALADMMPQVIEGLKSAGPALANTLPVLFAQVGAAFEQNMPLILEAVGAAAQSICEILVASAPAIFDGAFEAFNFILQALSEVAGPLAEALPQIISSFVASFAANAPTIFASAQALFMQLVQGAVAIIPSLAAALPTIINTVINALPGFIGTLLSAAVTLFTALIQAIPQITPGLLSAVGNLISTVVRNVPSFVGALLSAAVTLFTALVTAVGQVVGQLVSAVGNMLNSARNAISSFSLADVGRNFIQGFISGVTAMAGRVLDAVRNVFSNAVDAAKNLLGIHSPSRVMAEIGKYTTEGFVVGMAGGKQDVYRAAEELSQMAQKGVDDSILNIPLSDKIDMTASLVANAAYADTNRSIADLASRMDEMTSRLERALEAPMTLNANEREFARMVREVR
mgnify:FL=1